MTRFHIVGKRFEQVWGWYKYFWDFTVFHSFRIKMYFSQWWYFFEEIQVVFQHNTKPQQAQISTQIRQQNLNQPQREFHSHLSLMIALINEDFQFQMKRIFTSKDFWAYQGVFSCWHCLRSKWYHFHQPSGSSCWCMKWVDNFQCRCRIYWG